MKIAVKPTITQQKLNYYLYFGILTVALIVLMFMSSFLYKNFYQTITESGVILALKSQVASEMVDIKKFDIIMEKFKKKTSVSKEKITRNPFEKNKNTNEVAIVEEKIITN